MAINHKELPLQHDEVKWGVKIRLEKRLGEWTGDEIDAGLAPEPFEILEREGNLLMYGGASVLWEALIGNGTTTAGQALTFFNNTQAAIGVGNSTTAAVATQTNLQGTASPADRIRKGMDATYPQHSDGVVLAAADIIFRATFGTTEANFTWNEWGIFNSATDGTGRMLNRKVENLGTKTSAATWTLTITLTLA